MKKSIMISLVLGALSMLPLNVFASDGDGANIITPEVVETVEQD